MRANGYATSWLGKDHNTPSHQASRAGPFQWPNGMGFEYFYDFVGGDASRWRPNLLRKEQDIAQETKRVLMVAAVAEAVTGLALLLVPSIVAQVLLGRNLSAPP